MHLFNDITTLKDIYNFHPSLHGLWTVITAHNNRHCATIMACN